MLVRCCGEKDVNLLARLLLNQIRKALGVAVRVPVLEHDRLAFYMSEFARALAQVD
jgi:hypothetical protein